MRIMDRKSIAVVVGGRTPEHEISIRSGLDLVEALSGSLRFALDLVTIDTEGAWSAVDPKAYLSRFDYVLPLIHGGHDAGLHGLLSMLDLPVLGEGAANVALDKPLAKRLLREAGLPVLPEIVVTRGQLAIDARGQCDRIGREI